MCSIWCPTNRYHKCYAEFTFAGADPKETAPAESGALRLPLPCVRALPLLNHSCSHKKHLTWHYVSYM